MNSYMPVYKCIHVHLCELCTPTPFEIIEADETVWCCVFAKLYSLPLSRMFAVVNTCSSGLAGYLSLPSSPSLFYFSD